MIRPHHQIRSASLLEAERSYPTIILLMARGKMSCEAKNRDGFAYYDLYSKHISTSVTEEDFLILRDISSKVLSSFLSEPESSILDRALAYVRVEFSERKAF